MIKKATKKVVKKATKKVVVAKEDTYTAEMVVLGVTYKGIGDTVTDAIMALSPGNVRGKVVLVVSKGERSKEHYMSPVQASRLFNLHGVIREIAIKRLAQLFDF